MSQYPFLYPVPSIRTLIKAIGSKDASLVERMVEVYRLEAMSRYGEVPDGELAERREWCRSFVEGRTVRRQEPGEWTPASLLAARALDLSDGKPINDDWNSLAWYDYAKLVKGELAKPASKLLDFLVSGRPYLHKSLQRSGVYHGWLEQGEIQSLRSALGSLEEERPDIVDEVDGFHVQLMDWLDVCDTGDLLVVAR